MVVRIVIALLVLATVGGVALLMRRRPPDAPPRDVFPVPKQLDRSDFPRPDARWLVALFSSATCDSCHGLGDKLTPLESADVAVCDVDFEQQEALHRRYELAAIPTTVIADHEGVVCRAFVGAFTATDLWAAVAELRDPGSSPEPDLGSV
ncbi:MAG TPA: thioredoxin family protein [Acidimicrobiia bacterium]|nr:thioredoxin family protein [Acidimicrobiia bacterium]